MLQNLLPVSMSLTDISIDWPVRIVALKRLVSLAVLPVSAWRRNEVLLCLWNCVWSRIQLLPLQNSTGVGQFVCETVGVQCTCIVKLVSSASDALALESHSTTKLLCSSEDSSAICSASLDASPWSPDLLSWSFSYFINVTLSVAILFSFLPPLLIFPPLFFQTFWRTCRVSFACISNMDWQNAKRCVQLVPL